MVGVGSKYLALIYRKLIFSFQFQYLTVFSLELHVNTRADLRPDPEFDSIGAIFFSILDDVPPEKGQREITGAIIVDVESANHSAQDKGDGEGTSRSRSEQLLLERSGVTDLHATHVRNEDELLQEFLKLIARLANFTLCPVIV